MLERPVSRELSGSPLIGAVARFVIHLNIAARNHLMYGGEHPVAKKSTLEVLETLGVAVKNQGGVAIHFTPDSVLCGPYYLPRDNPIYKRFAQAMWAQGIVGLTCGKRLEADGMLRFIAYLTSIQRSQVTPRQAQEIWQGDPIPYIRLDFLRDLIRFAEYERVGGDGGSQEQAQLWEEFVEQVVGQSNPDVVVAGVPEAAEGKANKSPGDYAAGVIAYLKKLDTTRRQDVLVQGTHLGQKIGDFIARLDPHLREQIVASTVTSPEVSPAMLYRFLQLADYDFVVDALAGLNREGREIPATAFRTLSLMSLVNEHVRGVAPEELEVESPAEHQGYMQLLFEDLFVGEDRSAYMPDDYEEKLQALESYALERRRGPGMAPEEIQRQLSVEQGEAHFLRVVSDLLALRSDDPKLAAASVEELGRSLDACLEQKSFRLGREVIQRARTARAQVDDAAREPPFWEQDEVLERLTAELGAVDRDGAVELSLLLAAIGPPALPHLLDLLETSTSMSIRRRVIDAISLMEENPVPKILERLVPGSPWYVQRNLLHILRTRATAEGTRAAKRLWREARAQVKLEILRYLHAVGDSDWLPLLRDALGDRSPKVVLGAAQLVLKIAEREALQALIERAEQVPAWELGSLVHVELLKILGKSGRPEATKYLALLLERQQARLPWRRKRLLETVTGILEASPS